MFIGDSITEQWYPRYATGARYRDNALFVTRPGCPPIRDLDGYPPGKHCGEDAATIWNEVHNRKPGKLVISSVWWPDFFLASGEERNEACILSGVTCQAIHSIDQVRQAFAALEEDVKSVAQEGTEVVLIGPVPIGEFDYAEVSMSAIAARHLYLPLESAGQISLASAVTSERGLSSESAFRAENHAYSPSQITLDLLSGIAERTGAKLIIPQQYMCPRDLCPYTDKDGTPIYKDAMHLRASYVGSEALRWLDEAIGMQRVLPN